MPDYLLTELFIGLRQRVDQHSRDVQSARAELMEIRARSIEAISQSRELMARVDVLLTLPHAKQRL
jgi:hypothetical protein